MNLILLQLDLFYLFSLKNIIKLCANSSLVFIDLLSKKSLCLTLNFNSFNQNVFFDNTNAYLTAITRIALNHSLLAVNISVETMRFLLVLNSITYFTVFLVIVISFGKLKKIRNENLNYENKLKVILHDLKSPITSYQGLADIISFLIKNKQFDKIELISKQIDDYGSKLLKIFLDLQIGASSHSKSPNFLEISCLLDSLNPLLQTYRHIASISGVDITENYNLKAMIYTNPYLFQTIYRNLLDNAVKNSKPGSSIELTASEKEGKVLFSVTNYPSTLDYHKIEEMTQFLNSPELITPFSGKKMGLSIIKKYCKLLDINIIFRSECRKVIFELVVPTSPNKQGFIPNYRKLFRKYHKNWEETTEKQPNRFIIT